ncbi:MAG: hypothetical protein F6K56_06375 [Moorea sp. SIO3G5]|nr:hypothetical protein [Moorena sp. SIO3G5]
MTINSVIKFFCTGARSQYYRSLWLYHVGIITLNKNLPISPSPHLPTLPLIMGIQPDLILTVNGQRSTTNQTG